MVLRMLLGLMEPLPPPSTVLYQRLGLSRAQGSRWLRQLQNRGFVRVHRLSNARPGGVLSIAEPLDPARQWLADHGAPVDPPRHTRGGFLHNVAAEALLRLGKSRRNEVSFEVDLDAFRADVQWRTSGGLIFLYQIGISDAQREADALIRAWAIPVVRTSKLVLVCADKKFALTVIRAIKDGGGGPQLIAHLEWRLLGSLLERAAATSIPSREPNKPE